MFGSPRRLTGALVVLAVVAATPVLAGSVAFADSATSAASAKKPQALATLKVLAPNVSVKKKGSSSFTPAKDGDKLAQGDTVQTDATGSAEVDYKDNGQSYTRLDVNTTFTIKKLTDNQGKRQVQGSLDSGRTWNRTAALTESESYDQQGAGANATVLGTAFAVQCDTQQHCTFTAVVDNIGLTGADGSSKTLTPRDVCDSTTGNLCSQVDQLTVQQMIANTWIQQNLFLDLTQHGFGPGPFHLGGTIVVQNGQVVAFTPDANNSTAPGSTPPIVPPVPAPVFDNAHPVFVPGGGGAGVSSQVSCADPPAGYVCAPGINVEDENFTTFKINASDPNDFPFTVKFPTLPLPSVGLLCAPGTAIHGTNDCQYGSNSTKSGYAAIIDAPSQPLNTTTSFPSDTPFVFAPHDYETTAHDNTGSFTVTATPNSPAGSSATSDPVNVTVTEGGT